MKPFTAKLTIAALAVTAVVVHEIHVARAESGIVVVGGSADGPRWNTVGDAVKTAATKAGWSLVSSPLSLREAEKLVACADPAPYKCVPSSLGTRGIHRVLIVKVDPSTTDTGDPQLVLDAKIIVTDPKQLVVGKRHCEHCADDRLAAESTTLVEGMLRELATRSGRTVVEIKSVPTGAQIVLDGARVGFTDTTFNTYPGKHQITLEKPGYLSETVQVTIEEGKTETVSATLRLSVTSTPIAPVTTQSRRWPVAVLAIGGAAVLAGGVLVILDQDPSPSGDFRYRETARWGVGVGAAGLIVAGLGAYWFHRVSRSSSTPNAMRVPGGGLVGWSWMF